MKRRGIMVVVAGAVAVWGATPLAVASAANARAVSAAIGTVSTAGTWGNAIEVPGLGTLNAGGSAEVPSISCASASNCVAGGSYFNGSGHSQAIVVRKVKGTWGTPKNVPGLATLNTGMAETLLAVSCASARSTASWLPDSCSSVLTRAHRAQRGDMNKPYGPGATASG